jgi:hypothetical protein
MPAGVVTGFEMLREKLRRAGVTLMAAVLLTACTGPAEGPEVADLEELDVTEAATEPVDTEVVEDTEVAADEDGADDPTERTQPADDDTEPADGDPYAIPEDGIDEAYVERVLNAIFEVNREALAITLESEPGGLAPFEAEERLRAIYGGGYGARQLASLNEVSAEESERSVFRRPPGAVRVSVTAVAAGDPECVVVRRTSDFGEVLQDPPQPRAGYVALAPKPADGDPEGFNPTPWVIVGGSLESPEALTCES